MPLELQFVVRCRGCGYRQCLPVRPGEVHIGPARMISRDVDFPEGWEGDLCDGCVAARGIKSAPGARGKGRAS